MLAWRRMQFRPLRLSARASRRSISSVIPTSAIVAALAAQRVSTEALNNRWSHLLLQLATRRRMSRNARGDSNAGAALAARRTSTAALGNHQVLQVTILRRAHAALRVLAAALGNQRLLLVLQIKILRRQPCKARWKSIVSTRRRFPLRLKLIGDLHAVFLH